MQTEESISMNGATVTVRADWGNASSPIEVSYTEGSREPEFEGTQYQVADFGHDSDRALDHFAFVEENTRLVEPEDDDEEEEG
jgi:hypothetical protein